MVLSLILVPNRSHEVHHMLRVKLCGHVEYKDTWHWTFGSERTHWYYCRDSQLLYVIIFSVCPKPSPKIRTSPLPFSREEPCTIRHGGLNIRLNVKDAMPVSVRSELFKLLRIRFGWRGPGFNPRLRQGFLCLMFCFVVVVFFLFVKNNNIISHKSLQFLLHFSFI